MDTKKSDKVLQEFLAEAQEIVEGLGNDLTSLDDARASGKFDPDHLNNAFRAVHSLKGLSGLFGLTAMSQVSHTLETLLDSLRLGKVSVTPAILDVLFDAVELFGQLIGDTSGGREPDSSAVDDYLARLDHAAVDESEEEGEYDIGDYDIAEDVLNVLTEYEEHRLKENAREGRNLYRIHASFDLLTIDKEIEDIKHRLKPLGEVITYLPSPEADDPSKIELEVVLGSEAPIGNVRKGLKGMHARVKAVKRKRRGAAAKAESAQRPPAPLPVASVIEVSTAVPAGEQPAAEPEERQTSLRSVSQTVRVDIRKLDHLMNIVGELGIVRSGILLKLDELQESAAATELAGALHRDTRTLERKISELQMGILDVRMVPLGQVFDKLSRVVRKISRDASKEIRLLISGGDTEIDKLIVEELSDPLMHIIRNSIDHGIETTEVRRRNGKPDMGTIEVSAEQKGSHVIIEVSDDGRGFDEVRILETALKRGVIETGAATELSRRELLNLVFLPGFSTREDVTEISGRGVGMDVVKHNIAKLSGIIDVQSSSGRGAKIVVTLPLTLAIIPALIVQVAGRTYALPLNSVLETLAGDFEDVRTIESREVVNLRDQTLALTRLTDLFGLQHPGEDLSHFFVVVVGLAQHRLGLVVDEIVGQQDIVIKSMGKLMSEVPGIAGATELGGDQTVLVLDVAALIEESLQRVVEAA